MSKFLKIDELIDTVTEYVQIKLELIKLNLIEELAGMLAQLIALLLIMGMLMFTLMFGSLTISVLLNHIWDSPFLGYAAVTFFYLLLVAFFAYLLQSGKLQQAVEAQISKAVKKKEQLIEQKEDSDE